MAGDVVRVLVVGDDPLARAGLAVVLAHEPGAVAAGEAGADADLASAVDASAAHVILWDLGPDPDAALERLARMHGPPAPVVALLPDSLYAPPALAAGARGLAARTAGPRILAAAAQAAARGLIALDPSMAWGMLAPRDRGPDALIEDLSRREAEVLRLMAEGLSNKAIADRLGISEHTAKFHVHTILGKLGTQSRTEAVVRAARLGLLSL